jgi:copper oxidase (laccase) domain-containing protein
MAASFGNRGELDGAVVAAGAGKWRMDLSQLIVAQLADGFVGRWDVTDRCTVRDEAEFFSHRRDRGATGRMVAVICARRSDRPVNETAR